jgi:hypothetical protein
MWPDCQGSVRPPSYCLPSCMLLSQTELQLPTNALHFQLPPKLKVSITCSLFKMRPPKIQTEPQPWFSKAPTNLPKQAHSEGYFPSHAGHQINLMSQESRSHPSIFTQLFVLKLNRSTLTSFCSEQIRSFQPSNRRFQILESGGLLMLF